MCFRSLGTLPSSQFTPSMYEFEPIQIAEGGGDHDRCLLHRVHRALLVSRPHAYAAWKNEPPGPLLAVLKIRSHHRTIRAAGLEDAFAFPPAVGSDWFVDLFALGSVGSITEILNGGGENVSQPQHYSKSRFHPQVESRGSSQTPGASRRRHRSRCRIRPLNTS